MQDSALPLLSALREDNPHRRHLIILSVILVASLCVCSPGIQADPGQSFLLNPIGTYTSGDLITINGTTTHEDWNRIGIEIFPKQYWDTVCAFGNEGSGKVVFNLIASSAENYDPSCITLVRLNTDGTRTMQIMNITRDHVLITGPVEKTVLALKHWSVQIEKNDAGSPFSPGVYQVNVWDATNQKPDYDNPYPNGWDVSHTRIYPSTGRVNRWDDANRKEMFSVVLNIT